jgi:hypothetical protein
MGHDIYRTLIERGSMPILLHAPAKPVRVPYSFNIADFTIKTIGSLVAICMATLLIAAISAANPQSTTGEQATCSFWRQDEARS